MEDGAIREVRFALIHRGLPGDTPWFFRVALRSRAFLIVTAVITVTLSIIAANDSEWLLRFDQPISDWIRGEDEELRLARLTTELGSPTVAVTLGGLAVVALWRRCRASALTLAGLVAAALSADVVLKIIVDRARPPNPAVDTGLGSFPSGHVIHAVVIFGLVPFLLWVLTRKRALLRAGFVLFGVVVLSVAVSRVRLGAHWPSDVISSMLIGSSLLLGAEALLTSPWATDRCAALGHHPTVPAVPD